MNISRRHVVPLLFALLIVGPIVSMLVWSRSPPFVFVSGSVAPAAAKPGDPIPLHITAGGNAAITITLKWSRLCELESVRIVQDGEHKDWKIPSPPSTPPHTLDPRPLPSVRVINIPAGATPGAAHYRATVYLRCNPLDRLWPIKILIPPLPFEIKAA